MPELQLLALDPERDDVPLHAAVVSDRALYPFCGGVNGTFALEGGATTQWGTSPWHTPRDCVWPVDPNDLRGCTTLAAESIVALTSGPMYRCYEEGSTDVSATYCGSNFDVFGNARFVDAVHMRHPSWAADRNWGFTTFDTFIDAFNTIFQCFTEEGWTSIMYMYQDAKGRWTMLGMFLSLVMLGAYLLLNLVLAVLGDAFDKEQSAIVAQMEKEARVDEEIREGFQLLGGVKSHARRGNNGEIELDLLLVLALFPPRTLSKENVARILAQVRCDCLSLARICCTAVSCQRTHSPPRRKRLTLSRALTFFSPLTLPLTLPLPLIVRCGWQRIDGCPRVYRADEDVPADSRRAVSQACAPLHPRGASAAAGGAPAHVG